MLHLTGDTYTGCPWRAFTDPYVREVLDAYAFFETGQLSFYLPDPAHCIVEGLRHYHMVGARIRAKREKDDAPKGGSGSGTKYQARAVSVADLRIGGRD